MKSKFWIITVLLLFPAGNACSRIQWSLSPSIAQQYGYTEYELNVGYLDQTPGGTNVVRYIRSLLEFPLDVRLFGFQGDIYSSENTNRSWSVKLNVYTSLNDPKGLMKDHDWDRVDGYFNTKFSYTESNAEMSSWHLSLTATRELFEVANIEVSLQAGFQYQRIKQFVDNYEGWQSWPFDTVTYQYPSPRPIVATDRPVLEYKITYKLPQIGVAACWKANRILSADFNGTTIAVYASDVDDHLLRKKLSTASGNGIGMNLGTAFHVTTGSPFTGGRIMIDLYGDFTSLRAEGNQIQEWYDDEMTYDPSVGDMVVFVEKGTKLYDIPHTFRSTQYRIGFRVGLFFY